MPSLIVTHYGPGIPALFLKGNGGEVNLGRGEVRVLGAVEGGETGQDETYE